MAAYIRCDRCGCATDHAVYLCKRCVEDDKTELAAYRASGLRPERAAELGQADRDGRLLILPHNHNGTMYGIQDCEECPIYPIGIIRLNDFLEIGKTLFFTCDAAEAALVERKGSEQHG